MLVRNLPISFNTGKEITPPVYSDHFLFSENLRREYECPEHPAGIGLLIAGTGVCDYFVNGVKNRLGDGQAFFIDRGSQLAIRSAGAVSTPALLFFHSRLPDLVQHSLNYGDEVQLEEEFDNLPYDFSYLERVHVDKQLFETVLSLIELGCSCSSFALLKADIVIRTLFEELLRKNQEGYKASKNIQAVKASTRLEIFKRVSLVRDWMEAHYNTDISLEDLAGVSTMNSQHFLRMFKQVYHITPHQFLMDLRLRKARELLETTKATVQEICSAVGFESVFSFSVLYKSRFGQAPSRCRGDE